MQSETDGKTIPTCLSDGRKAGPQHEQGFAAETAAVSGETKRSINQHIARAEALGDDINEVVGTSKALPWKPSCILCAHSRDMAIGGNHREGRVESLAHQHRKPVG